MLFAFFPILVSAHPGATNGNGCHTCKTNCPSYGLRTGQYHCHDNDRDNNYPVSSTSNTRKNNNDGFTLELWMLIVGGVIFWIFYHFIDEKNHKKK